MSRGPERAGGSGTSGPIRRVHLFELEDQPWLPSSLRAVVTRTLQLMITSFRVYEPAVPLLAKALASSGTNRIVDLCSGSGGPWPRLIALLRSEVPGARVTLTDRFPQPDALASAEELEGLEYWHDPVDARAVPASLEGVRTLFTGFHHFAPDEASAILGDAVAHRAPIAVFESTRRGALNVALAATVGPLGLLLGLPWVRPFRWTHLLWTYVLPVAPLVYAWDGAVSNARTYSLEELRWLAARADGDGSYDWDIGEIVVPKAPAPITYLVGCPR